MFSISYESVTAAVEWRRELVIALVNEQTFVVRLEVQGRASTKEAAEE